MSDSHDAAKFLREQAELLGPDEAELDKRTEELLQRLEFTAMMRTGMVGPPARESVLKLTTGQ